MATSSNATVVIDETQTPTHKTPTPEPTETVGNPDATTVDSKKPCYLTWLQKQGSLSHPSAALKSQLLDLSDTNITQQFIKKWISNQLKKYVDAFANSTDGNLTNIQKRFDWIASWLDQYTIDYASIFPPKWHVAMRFAVAWCDTTNRNLVAVMEVMHPDTLTAQALKPALKTTRAFEKSLDVGFACHLPNKATLNAPTDKAEDQLPSSITEVLVQLMPADHPSLTPPTIDAQPSFDNLISQCFEKYLSLIIETETKQMDQKYENIMMNAQWTIDAASTTFIFPSARCLFDLICASREKLATNDNPTVVIGIVACYKRLLIDYHRSLGDQVYKMNAPKLLCWIINTSEYILAMIRVLTIVLNYDDATADLKEAMNMVEVYDMYRMLVTRVVHTLTVGIYGAAIHVPRWPGMSDMKLRIASTNMRASLIAAINPLQRELVNIEVQFNTHTESYGPTLADMPNRKNHFGPICSALIGLVAQKVMDRIGDVSEEKALPPDEYARFIQVVDAIEATLCAIPTIHQSLPDLKEPYLLNGPAFIDMVKQKLMPVRQVIGVLSVPLNTIRYALSMIDFTMTPSTKQ